jgi:G:T-mismatch repair DNA endonuclease (very short patch repair protein)
MHIWAAGSCSSVFPARHRQARAAAMARNVRRDKQVEKVLDQVGDVADAVLHGLILDEPQQRGFIRLLRKFLRMHQPIPYSP